MLTCLGCGAADDGVEGLRDVLQPGEGHAQARPVLVVGQRARHPVEVEADRGRDILAERLHIINNHKHGHIEEMYLVEIQTKVYPKVSNHGEDPY